MSERSKYLTVNERVLKGEARLILTARSRRLRSLHEKRKSIAAIKDLGLPFTDHLPVVEDETSIIPRSAEEIAERALALAISAVKGESNDGIWAGIGMI